ncbi:prenyltransferase [Salarchaeum japonicum]|uniref:prenyltransferase n=1 Tax=Salarchaeum japonicum TaxID=555573 RepID=UPI003C71F613
MDYRYLLTLSRPRFWLYLAGPVLVGATYAATGVSDLAAPVVLALAAYFLVPANVLLYGVNDVFDRDVDEHNPKKEEREARYRGSRDVLVALAVSGVLGLGTFAITPPVSWPWLAGFFALAVGYSAPPVRFKTTPVLDSVSNGLYVLPGAAAYAAVAGTHPPALAVLGGWLWTMGMHTFSAIPDIEPDREAGIRTTATWLGESTTFAYCIGVWALAAAGFALLDLRFLVVFGVYPAFCAWVAASDVSVDRAYWWFPYLNALAGMLLTLGGLWRLYG